MLKLVGLGLMIFPLIALVPPVSFASVSTRGYIQPEVKIRLEKPNKLSKVENKLQLEFVSTLGENATAKAIIDSKVDSLTHLDEAELDLKETYLDLYFKSVDLRIGKQLITWGTADEINPTDNLNPQNLSNPMVEKSERKIGIPSLRSDFYLGDFALESIWIPAFVASTLPQVGSDWAFFTMPPEVPNPEYPQNKLKNSQWALKLLRTISGFDFSVSYFDGWNHVFTPYIKDNEFSLKYYRTGVLGADFAGSLSNIGIWGESAYFLTRDEKGVDPLIKNPYIQYVLGADNTFKSGVTVSLQYAQEILTKIDSQEERKAEEQIISKMGMGISARRAIALRVKKDFGEANSAELFGLFDIADQGALIKPQVKLSPADGVNFYLGLSLFSGEEGSVFGKFTHNDEVYVKLKYSF